MQENPPAIGAPSGFFGFDGSYAAAQPAVLAVRVRKKSEALVLQVLGGSCLGLVASKVSLVECQEGQGAWVVTQDGQVKQGNTCLVVAGSTVAAADCDDAASTGGDKFFQVAVPDHDPVAVVAVQEVGALLRASVQRQQSLVESLQRLVPKLASCRPVSLAAVNTFPAFVQIEQQLQSSGDQAELDESLPGKVADNFGPGRAALAAVLASSSDVLKLVASKA